MISCIANDTIDCQHTTNILPTCAKFMARFCQEYVNFLPKAVVKMMPTCIQDWCVPNIIIILDQDKKCNNKICLYTQWCLFIVFFNYVISRIGWLIANRGNLCAFRQFTIFIRWSWCNALISFIIFIWCHI